MSIGQADSASSLSEVHRTHLAHIADTDALPEDLDWLPLRQAIFEHIRSLLSSWPDSEVELHKAASLLSSSTDAGAATAESAGAEPTANTPAPLVDRFVAASAPESEPTAADSTSAPEPSNDENEPPIPKAALAATTAAPSDLSTSISVSTEDSLDLDAEQKQRMEMAAAWGVKPGDEQHFYASKRKAPAEAPWKGSWGRAPQGEALEEEIKEIERGLASFEAPPFTMQRLAELVLAPLDSARTPGKYLSALRRCLAVTATHESFTSLPVDESASVPTNGFITSGTGGYDVTAPSTAPLFSPIPFLTTLPDDVSEEEVPGMELGGADRTTEEASIEAGNSGAGRAGAAPGTAGAMADSPPSSSAAQASDAPTQGAAQPVPVVAPAPSVPHGATAPLVPVEPLGVPAGKIDEVDDLPHAGAARPIVALSSTTAAPASTAESSSAAATVAVEADAKEAASAPDGGRATKRAKPEADADVEMTDRTEEGTSSSSSAAAPAPASAPGVVKAVADELDERARTTDAPEAQD